MKRSLLFVALTVVVSGGCKKKKDDEGEYSGGGNPTVHGAEQGVRKAVERTVTAAELHDLHLFINTVKGASGQMPTSQQTWEALTRPDAGESHMATVYVNDKPVDIGNDRLNCVQAADRAGLHLPHYCYHPGLTVVASCRMCLVEMGDLKDGKVTMIPKVFPGCQTPVKDGTVIVTGDYDQRDRSIPPLAYDPKYVPGDKAKKAQADTLEGLLLNHPLDCPVCDKAGECKLQDYAFDYGRSQTRMVDEKNQPPNKPEISSKITLFTDRCILCTRCVRFTREVTGTAELTVVSRGHHSEIDVFPGEPLENKLSGNVVDLCPVGALGSKDFLYKQRVWYLKSTESVCGRCSTGCSIHVDTNKDVVFRLRPRENPQANGYWMCDEGRYGYHHADAADRIKRPHVRKGGTLVPVPYSEAVKELRDDF